MIAGKGHETYQILGEGVIPFDDREVVKICIEKILKQQDERLSYHRKDPKGHGGQADPGRSKGSGWILLHRYSNAPGGGPLHRLKGRISMAMVSSGKALRKGARGPSSLPMSAWRARDSIFYYKVEDI